MDREIELELVARLRHGDPEAFDAVHAAFNARLYNFLARLSNRRDVAEDLLEETWLRLVIHAPRLRPDTRLGPWLFTVARNLHTSYCRSRLLEDSHSSGLLGLWPSGSPGPSPFEEAEASEVQRRIATAADGAERGHDMMSHDGHEPMARSLARLRPLVPDPAHSERVRVRCRVQIGRKGRWWDQVALVAQSSRRVLAPAVLGSLCLFYVAALVGTLLRLRGTSH